jgi:DNA-directed RNA polymerase subunit RPC12/RpoP
MQEHEFEVSRYKVRESCIQAGWDFPHESPIPEITLAGEHDCPSCSSRLLEKQTLQVQMEANRLKDRELSLREANAWVVETAPYRRAYVMPPPTTTTQPKGGQFVDPIRNDQSA